MTEALAQQETQFDLPLTEAGGSFDGNRITSVQPFKTQLLKWIGNKQRFAHEIISFFPDDMRAYHEPFLGSGAVLGSLAPNEGYGSDCFVPLIEIWQTLKSAPMTLKDWYQQRWELVDKLGKVEAYEEVKASFNSQPNGADFLFLTRACYGGVVRFRKADGYMSTPCGAHNPINPDSFNKRVDAWYDRVKASNFQAMEYGDAMDRAKEGDVVYCDPPYSYSQAILYGAQAFSLADLFEKIGECKERGVRVALSIDGSKKSGDFVCDIHIPDGLFEREVAVNVGRSMLKRFQMEGKSLEDENVSDRLLLTY